MNDRVIQEVTRCIKRTHCCPRFIRRRYDVSSWLTTSSVRFKLESPSINFDFFFNYSARALLRRGIPSRRKSPFQQVVGWERWMTVISRLFFIFYKNRFFVFFFEKKNLNRYYRSVRVPTHNAKS